MKWGNVNFPLTEIYFMLPQFLLWLWNLDTGLLFRFKNKIFSKENIYFLTRSFSRENIVQVHLHHFDQHSFEELEICWKSCPVTQEVYLFSTRYNQKKIFKTSFNCHIITVFRFVALFLSAYIITRDNILDVA